jgi:hypothetical protein
MKCSSLRSSNASFEISRSLVSEFNYFRQSSSNIPAASEVSDMSINILVKNDDFALVGSDIVDNSDVFDKKGIITGLMTISQPIAIPSILCLLALSCLNHCLDA